MHDPQSWFRTEDLDRPARVRLLCLPHAGSGASSFYRWRALLPAAVRVCPVLLPGRDLRMGVPALCSVSAVVQGLMEAADACAGTLFAEPYAIYGHSMGSLLAYEWTRALVAARLPPPMLLAVGGRNAPQIPLPDAELHRLEEAAFAEQIQMRYGKLPPEVISDAATRALFLSILRADLTAVETYRYRPGPRLDVPLAAFAGSSDPTVTAAGLEAWSDLTRTPIPGERLTGDHFFHFGAGQPALLEHLAGLLRH